jgi:hypothetical protein
MCGDAPYHEILLSSYVFFDKYNLGTDRHHLITGLGGASKSALRVSTNMFSIDIETHMHHISTVVFVEFEGRPINIPEKLS